MNENVITNLEQVTPEWLTAVLTRSGALTQGTVVGFDVTDGRGNWSTSGSLSLEYSPDAQGERLAQRARQFPDAPVATWSQVDTQRRYFQPWQPGQALFLDGLNSVEDNFAAAMAFISDPNIRLTGWD